MYLALDDVQQREPMPTLRSLSTSSRSPSTSVRPWYYGYE